MPNPLVSVIVPTKNSAILLNTLLDSVQKQTYKNIEVIVNDDVASTDNTQEIITTYRTKGLNVGYLQENISMAQGRKVGVEHAKGDIFLHLDSDMKLEPALIEECVLLTKKGFEALVIPEESFGVGFWAQCKWLEKKCYEGVQNIESLRCIKKEVYESIGGHNPKLVFSEDKDLDIRVRSAGYKIARTKSKIFHNEGELKLGKTLNKKLSYSRTANEFAALHPKEFAWQRNIVYRYGIYLKNIKYLFMHPLLYIGMIYMKTCEFMFGGVGYAVAFINK